MFAPLFTAVLLATATPATLETPPTNGEDKATTSVQTLTLRTNPGGELMMNGFPCQDTTIVLHNAHVATVADANTYSVALPDGRIFYQGDLNITVQSRETGTMKIAIKDGEASLNRAKIN